MPVKIVHTITKLELGGAQTTTLYTLNNLPDNYEGYLVCGKGGFLDAEADSASRYKTSFCPVLIRKINPYLDWRAYRWLIKYFEEIKPDIVHSHSSKAGILSRWAAKKAGVPVIIHTFHGFGFTPLQFGLARRLFIRLEKKAAKKSTKLIFVSHENREKAFNLKIGREDQYEVIRSGIEIEKFAGLEKKDYIKNLFGLKPGDKVVGNISCFKPQKGLADYIQACRRLKEKGDYKFILVGDGNLRKKLERQVKKAGLDDCFFMPGWRTDIEKIMPGFDIILHTSYFEGLSKVLLQAMACELPIVATAVDGAFDVIEDGVNGYLVKPGDIDAMVKYTHELLQDDTKRKVFGGKGREKLKPEFDIKVMSDVLNELYEELVKG